ncbi:MAG: hypothetical protein LBB25_03160 [Holosporaceae bacterium]|nr:hypothetical protein [Holosporaceae bacterium]
MYVHKNLINSLIIGLIFLATATELSAVSQTDSDVSAEEEENNYPFTKSETEINPKDVVGIRIKKGKVILLSIHNKYSIEKLPDNFSFSSLNFSKQYQKLISIEFNGVKLTTEILESLIKSVPLHLKGFVLRRCSIGKENHELLAYFLEKCLAISFVNIVLSDLSGEGASRVLHSLRRHRLKYFGYNTCAEITDEGGDNLAEVISQSAETLLEVSVGCGNITADAWQNVTTAISKINKLEKLELAAEALPEDSLEGTAEFLGDCGKLESLKIFFSLVNRDPAKILALGEGFQRSLKKLSRLQMLNISDMNFPVEVMHSIAEAIENLKDLKTLDISGNAIDKEAAEIFAKSFKACHPGILIANNCKLTAESVTEFCKSFEGSNLKVLCLRGNEIKDGIKNLPIATMPEIRAIDFSRTGINPDDVMALAKQTNGLENLKFVNLSGNSEIEAMNSVERIIMMDRLMEDNSNRKGNQISFLGI